MYKFYTLGQFHKLKGDQKEIKECLHLVAKYGIMASRITMHHKGYKCNFPNFRTKILAFCQAAV